MQVNAFTTGWWATFSLFFFPSGLYRVWDELIKYGKATKCVWRRRGKGEVKPAKLASDHWLSQLELDYVTCEYFIATNWQTSSQAIKANQGKIWVLCSSATSCINILRGKPRKTIYFFLLATRKKCRYSFIHKHALLSGNCRGQTSWKKDLGRPVGGKF